MASITKVEFILDGVKVGEALSAPFQINWQATGTGSKTLVARAHISDGTTVDSPLRTFSVAAAAVQTFVLDDYPNAYTAVSVRKLRSAYAGPCLRVRRTWDNIEQDIAFNASGLVDTAAMDAFSAGVQLAVVKWYDQSGNARDWVVSTGDVQPYLYNDTGTAMVRNSVSGRPALHNHQAGCRMNTPIAGVTTGTAFSVVRDELTTQFMVLGGDASARFLGAAASGDTAAPTGGAGTPSIFVNGAALSANTRGALRAAVTGTAAQTVSFTGLNLTGWAAIASRYSSNAWRSPKYMQEYILYATDRGADRAAIEADQQAFYST